MLLGTEIGAALTALGAMRPDVFGLNCATGPGEMSEHLRHLSQQSPVPISCLPNAGLPSIVDGQTHYDLTPDRAGRVPQPLHHRARRVGRRRLLRHHARAPAPGGRAVRDLTPLARTPVVGAGGDVDLQHGAVPPGHVVPRHRRAHQRQRLEEVPRRHARAGLGHVPGHGARAGQGGRPRPRRVRRLRGPRRRRRHGRDRPALRHPGDRPARARLHRAAGARSRPAVDRRQGHPQLGQPRGGRGRGQALRPGDVARRRVRRRRHLPAHRRGGPGPRRRVEAASRIASTTSPSTATGCSRATSSSTRSRSRCRPAATTCAATPWPPSRPSAASRPSCPACTPPSACPTCRSASSRRPATSSTRCSCTSASRPASTPPSCTRRASCPLNRIDERQRQICLDLIYDRRTADYDPLQELLAAFEDVSVGAVEKEDRSGWPGRGAPQAPHHRRRPRRPRGRPRRGAHHPHGARDRQRRAARRHEGRGRAVRLGRDAAAVRAAVGRDHEGGRRLPRAPHGEGRPGRQGPHRAGHGQGRRPRHRQEPGRHHPHQQRLRGAQPRHQGGGQRACWPRPRRSAPTPSA